MSNTEQAFNEFIRLQQGLPEEEEQEGLIPLDISQAYNTPQPTDSQQVDPSRVPLEDVLYKPVDEVYEYSKWGNGKKYSLADLEQDDEFQTRAERFMENIGQDEEIYEYLRDPNFSIGAAFQRSIDVKSWSDEAIEDYVWLQDAFDNAEVGGFKQAMGLAKDLTIDLVTDPFNLLAMMFVPMSLGTSLTARAAANRALLQATKKLTTDATKKKLSLKRLGKFAKPGTVQAAKFGAVEGAAFTGPHDYFLQDAEKELGLRESIDLTQTATAAAFGTAFGGMIGGSIGAFTSLSPFLRNKIRRYADEDAIIDHSQGFVNIGALRSKVKKDYKAEEVVVDPDITQTNFDVFINNLNNPGQATRKWVKDRTRNPLSPKPVKEITAFNKYIVGYFGKATASLAPIFNSIENAPVFGRFLGEIRHDFYRTLTKGNTGNVETFGYGEIVSGRTAFWRTALESALTPLFRATWKDGSGYKQKLHNLFNEVVDYDQNEQLLQMLWNPKAQKISYKNAQGETLEFYTKKKFRPEGDETPIMDEVIHKSAADIRKLTGQIFKEAARAGIVDPARRIINYFPRKFQLDKILADEEGFTKIIQNSTHSEANNGYYAADYIIDKKNYTRQGQYTQKFIAEAKEKGVDIKLLRESTEYGGDTSELQILEQLRGVELASIPTNLKPVDQRVFNRDFIKEVAEDKRFKGKSKLVQNEEVKLRKATAIKDDILAKGDQPFMQVSYQDGVNYRTPKVSGEYKQRLFTDIEDDKFINFVDRDVQRVLGDYVINSAATITRVEKFGIDRRAFEKTFLSPIKAELREAGIDGAELADIMARVEELYTKTTGIEKQTIEGMISSPKTGRMARNLVDLAKTSQQLAHLPLATISSLTEPLLLLSRVESRDAPEALNDVRKALVKGVRKEADRWARARQKLNGEKVTGFKDINDADWREIYEVGLALEASVMDRLDGLYGQAAKNEGIRSVQNSFFKLNLLTQWTGAVQLAAFTTGKKLIRRNAEILHNSSPKSQAYKRAKRFLAEGGLDEQATKRWYKNSINKKTGEFDSDLAQGLKGSKAFQKKQYAWYHNYHQRSAVRFAKEIILSPTTAEANRPLWHSHPAGQILAQFAGYPTAFNNTILKRFVTDSIQDPTSAAPKVISTTLLMTAVATLTNAIRSGGESISEDKEPQEIITRSIQRWGGLGPLEVAYRYKANAGIGSGPLGATLKAPSGPLVQDAIDMLIYRKGVAEVATSNLPGSAAYSMVFGDAYRDFMQENARKFDKETWGRAFGPVKNPRQKKIKLQTYGYATGGIVDIPNTKEEPDERIDRMTGLPYNQQAGILGQDEDERLGFAEGGEASTDEEVISYLTKRTRLAAPILNGGAIVPVYDKKDLKDFTKGITATVYRSIENNLDAQNLQQFELADHIGVHVRTQEDPNKMAGKIRINTPLDLRSKNIKDFEGAAFLRTLLEKEEVRNIVIKDAKLPKEESKEKVIDLVSEYLYTIKQVRQEEPKDIKRVAHAMNVKFSQEIKDTLNDLGYDSILYKENKKDVAILLEAGQFRSIKNIEAMPTQNFHKGGPVHRKRYDRGGKILASLREYAKRPVRTLWSDIVRGGHKLGLVPTHYQYAIRDILGDKREKGAESMTESELATLRKISAQQIKNKKQTMGYTEIGVSTTNMTNNQTEKLKAARKKQVKKYGEQGFVDRDKLIKSLGGSFIERDNDGTYWVVDQYNWNPRSSNEGEAKQWLQVAHSGKEYSKGNTGSYPFFRSLGGALGSEKGEGPMTRIKIGTASDLGLSSKQDIRWSRKYQDSKYVPEKIDPKGFFEGLTPEDYQKDIKKSKESFGKQFAQSGFGSLLGYKPASVSAKTTPTVKNDTSWFGSLLDREDLAGNVRKGKYKNKP